MNNKKLNTKIVLLTLIAIGLSAVSYYFWEDYLFSHFLGGYDQYGLPKQFSGNGYYFFLKAWPLWVYPVVLIGLLVGVFYVIGFDEKINTMKKNKLNAEQQKKENEAIQQELVDIKKTLGQTHSDYKREIKKMTIKNEEAEKEFVALMEEYQQSLVLIEKLLIEKNDAKQDG